MTNDEDLTEADIDALMTEAESVWIIGPTYEARVTCDDGWWMVAVPDLDILSQLDSRYHFGADNDFGSDRDAPVLAIARSLISIHEGVPMDAFNVTVVWPDDAEEA